MFCLKCGKENTEGSGFCAFCGAPLEGAAAERKPRKSRKGLIVAGLSVLAVLAAAGALILTNFSMCANLALRTFASPLKYYQFVEGKNAVSLSETAAEVYDGTLRSAPNPGDTRQEMSLTLELGDAAAALLATYSGEDFSWLRQVSLTGDASRRGSDVGGTWALSLNGDRLISAEMTAALDERAAYVRVPELSGDYMAVDLSQTPELNGDTSLDSVLDELSGLYESLPDKQLARQVLLRYLRMALDDIESVKKGKQKLSAGGVSERYTTLTVTLTEEDARRIVEDVCTALEKDEDVRKILEDMEDALEKDGLYDRFRDGLDKALDRVDEITLDDDIVMTLWIDGRGTVRGRRLEAGDAELLFAMPEQGGRFGFEFSAASGSDGFFLTGNGKKSGELLSGGFTLELNGTEYADIDVVRFDTEVWKRGRFLGEVTVTPTRKLYTGLGVYSVTATYLSELSFTLSFDNTAREFHTELRALLGDAPFANLTMEGRAGDAGTIAAVTDGETPEEWLEQVVQGNSLADYLTELSRTELPAKYVEQLERLGSGLALYYRFSR